jgi:predicted nucleotidyltransferase
LQALFQRPVDLVVASAIQNPYFRQAVDANKTLVYAD